jgi:hypothetical protein
VVIPAIESANPSAHGIPDPYWTFYLVNIALYGTLLWMFRRLSLKDADTRLGRAKITGRNLVATEHRAEGDRLGTSPVS